MVCFNPVVILFFQNIIRFFFLGRNFKKSLPRLFRQKASCKKVLILHLIIFLSFFICNAPFVCIRINIGYDRELSQTIPEYIMELVFLLQFFTSLTNTSIFIIYKAAFSKRNKKEKKNCN